MNEPEIVLKPRGARSITTVEKSMTVDESHERKCHDCGNVAMHERAITPEVLCSKCGSQDTRRTDRRRVNHEKLMEVRHRDGTVVTQGSFNHLMCRLDTLEVKAKELKALRESLTDHEQCAVCKKWKHVEDMLRPHGNSEDLCCDEGCCQAWNDNHK